MSRIRKRIRTSTEDELQTRAYAARVNARPGYESRQACSADAVRTAGMTRHLLMGAACVGLTLASGVGDSYGFIHATGAWRGGALVGSELARSAIGFAVGIGTYWLVVRYLAELGSDRRRFRRSAGLR